MHIAICDDDRYIREQLHKLLQKYFCDRQIKCPLIRVYETGEALLKDEDMADIIFLDMEMPGLDGIYVGNELRKRNPKVIIFVITSYIEYLDDAMRFQVFRYLTKPIEKYRLERNLTEALALFNHSTSNKLPVETKKGVITLTYHDLVMVEAQSRKIIVHTLSDQLESIHTMDHWTNLLKDAPFFQVHRSYIVNMEHITRFDHSLIYLNNGQIQAYLTKRKYSLFKNAYLMYMEALR